MIRATMFCFLYALLNVSGAAMIKWKLRGRSLVALDDWIRLLMDVQVVGAFALIFVSALVMFKALSTGNFTFVIPVATGINFVLTVLAGYYLFKDQLNVLSFVGFGLIISGIILLGVNNAHVK
jgi:multidrug transporter EmrE-like cation transporter